MIEEQVKGIFSSVLGMNLSDVTDDTSMENTSQWDSIMHLNLLTTAEEILNVRFTDKQVITITSFPLLVNAVKEMKQEKN